MSRLQDEVRAIVEQEGVVVRAAHPALRGGIEGLLRTGELAPVLPGVYAAASRTQQRPTRVLALARREPDAVLVRRTAAQLSFWPGLSGEEVSYALSSVRPGRRGFCHERRRVPPELVLERSGLRMSVPALTALDLCTELGGDAIDQVLRTRTATLAGLHRALEITGHRRGNNDRRTLLVESRDEPWSAAERVTHRLLRDAGITGWKGNRPVVVDGLRYYLDVCFASLRLVVEIDGRLHETDLDVFENDRLRQNALVLEGWMVLRFTWAMLRDHPADVVRDIRKALADRRRRFSDTRG